MLTFGLFPNTKKKPVKAVLQKLISFLEQHGAGVCMPVLIAKELGYEKYSCANELLHSKVDVAFTLGGDGTLLQAMRELAPFQIPICGINMGQLGFLTEIETCEMETYIKHVLDGNYYIEERLMLVAEVWQNDSMIYSTSALNDIVVAKGGFSRIIRMKLSVDNEVTMNYPADGLIVATSTGSTGYSLSAGGPIINPRIRVIVITPICPHTLQARSIVVSESEEIKIEMQATHNDIVLTVDGQNIRSLNPEDKVLVKSAPYNAKFIRFEGKSYYECLRTKLRRGDYHDTAECSTNS